MTIANLECGNIAESSKFELLGAALVCPTRNNMK